MLLIWFCHYMSNDWLQLIEQKEDAEENTSPMTTPIFMAFEMRIPPTGFLEDAPEAVYKTDEGIQGRCPGLEWRDDVNKAAVASTHEDEKEDKDLKAKAKRLRKEKQAANAKARLLKAEAEKEDICQAAAKEAGGIKAPSLEIISWLRAQYSQGLKLSPSIGFFLTGCPRSLPKCRALVDEKKHFVFAVQAEAPDTN